MHASDGTFGKFGKWGGTTTTTAAMTPPTNARPAATAKVPLTISQGDIRMSEDRNEGFAPFAAATDMAGAA